MTSFVIRTNALARRFLSGAASLAGDMRWSCVPPLMVYFAAGVSGFTGIIEAFFVKENLGLSAAVLASLGFWAGLPWTMKMPLGHLIDQFWHRKALFVYLGAALMAASLLIMVERTGHTGWMATVLSLDTWYIVAVMLAPITYVLQDVVADAMVLERGSYDELGLLMIVTMAIGLGLPVLAVWTFQPHPNESWRNLGARLRLLRAYFTN